MDNSAFRVIAKKLPRITVLGVQHNNIGVAGLGSIIDLADLKRLYTGNDSVTQVETPLAMKA